MGSLARTGRGHLTDAAVAAGLSGHDLDRDVATPLLSVLAAVRAAGKVGIGDRRFAFRPDEDIVFDPSHHQLLHPNTLRFELLGDEGRVVLAEEYWSLSGGAVAGGTFGPESAGKGRFTMTDVLAACRERGTDLLGLVRENERRLGRTDDEIETRLSALWAAMRDCICGELTTRGVLPGPLRLARRAADIHDAMQGREGERQVLAREMDLASAYAIAVAEENAAGGRVVTAPTCAPPGFSPPSCAPFRRRSGFRIGGSTMPSSWQA